MKIFIILDKYEKFYYVNYKEILILTNYNYNYSPKNFYNKSDFIFTYSLKKLRRNYE